MRAITGVTRGVKGTAALLLLIGGLAMSTSADADPIPIGTTPADDLIFNFNFAAVLAGAPYSQVSIDIDLTGFGIGDAFFMDVFKDLNGGGGIDFSFGPLTCIICGSGVVHINVLYTSLTSPDILDGIFSVRIPPRQRRHGPDVDHSDGDQRGRSFYYAARNADQRARAGHDESQSLARARGNGPQAYLPSARQLIEIVIAYTIGSHDAAIAAVPVSGLVVAGTTKHRYPDVNSLITRSVVPCSRTQSSVIRRFHYFPEIGGGEHRYVDNRDPAIASPISRGLHARHIS